MLIANNPFHPETPKPESSTVELPLFVIRNSQFEIHHSRSRCPIPLSHGGPWDTGWGTEFSEFFLTKRTQFPALALSKTRFPSTKRTQTNPKRTQKRPKNNANEPKTNPNEPTQPPKPRPHVQDALSRGDSLKASQGFLRHGARPSTWPEYLESAGRLQLREPANGTGRSTGLRRRLPKRRVGRIPVPSPAPLPLHRHRCKP